MPLLLPKREAHKNGGNKTRICLNGAVMYSGCSTFTENSENSGWEVNGTRLFVIAHWKFLGRNGCVVILFTRQAVPNGNSCSSYRFALFVQFRAVRFSRTRASTKMAGSWENFE